MRSVFWLKAIGVLSAALVLTGCPGEKSDPQPQQAAPRTESTGMLTDGVALRVQPIVVKGTTGLTRSTSTASNGTFTVNMSELSGPYLFANSQSPAGNPDLIFLTSVTTRLGATNVTPLTTLLTAQVLGVTPLNAFQTYNTTLAKGQITEANLTAAQADLTTFLQDALGIQVKSGTSSFVTASFNTNVGDPMYDTILALAAKITGDGTTLGAVAERVAIGAQACLTEKIQVSIGGQQKKFCPVSKSNVPEEQDTTILDYKFRDITGAVLLIKVRDNSVLSADFTTAGNVTYSCTGAACGGVSLGAKAAGDSRAIVFGSLALTANGSGALLQGTFIGPPPSIELPILPCTDNRYFAIFSNNSALGDCIQPDDPFQFGATVGNTKGHGRLGISFNGQADDTGRVEIVVDRATFAPSYVYFTRQDPETGETSRYVCRVAECKGVTWGAARPESAGGFALELRTITLDNTMLQGIDANGNPTPESVTLRLSGLGMFIANDPDPPEEPEPTYPPLTDCDPAADTISVTGPSGEFNLCAPQNDPDNGVFWRIPYDLGDGYFQLFFSNETGDSFGVTTLNGELFDAYVSLSNGLTFNCTAPGCSGITVSGPDADGQYTLSFSGTVMRLVDFSGDPPTPNRPTLTLTSGDLVMPPQ